MEAALEHRSRPQIGSSLPESNTPTMGHGGNVMASRADCQISSAPVHFLTRTRQAFTVERVTCVVSTILLVWLVLYPLAILLIGSVRTDLPMRPGSFTLSNFTTLFAEPANRTAIVNTVVSSGLATIVAVVMGVGLAWITSRTD